MSLQNIYESLGEMTKSEAMQVFDGVMLGDGGLEPPTRRRIRKGGNSFFCLSQLGKQHIDWLWQVRKALELLSFSFTDNYPCIYHARSHGRPYTFCCLKSRRTSIATEQRERWYPQGIKEVPEDIVLTPIVLANWFMGGGGTSWWPCGNLVYLCLSPASFSLKSIEVLELRLEEVGLGGMRRTADRRVKRGSGINLVTSSTELITKFINTIEPFIVPSFQYKLKKPWLRKNKPSTS